MSSTTQAFNLRQQHENNINNFSEQLSTHKLWYLVSSQQGGEQEYDKVYDAETGLIYSLAEIKALFTEHSFIDVFNEHEKFVGTLDTSTKLLWNNSLSSHYTFIDLARKIVAEAELGGCKGWQLPTKDWLEAFAKKEANPYRLGRRYRLQAKVNKESVGSSYSWLCTEGRVDIDEGCFRVTTDHGHIFAINQIFQQKPIEHLLPLLYSYPLKLGGEVLAKADSSWQKLNREQLIEKLAQSHQNLLAVDDQKSLIIAKQHWTSQQLKNLDYTSCRLPVLEPYQLSDPNKGLWELFKQEAEILKQLNYVARDPKQDIKRQAVAIDFGTSSTVVAMEDESGGRRLLRIGVRDFFDTVKAQHFENPTVLECLDFNAFNRVWNSEAYRPALNWDWMRCAHEAQEKFRDNSGDTTVLASILPRLKQWALRSAEHKKVRLSDLHGVEIEIPTYSERNPVLGQALQTSTADPFDPIELYAWYLGMAINYRERGIFLKYYLSFPVKYERDVKERILASFRRGLQRSLPDTLVRHHPETLNEFEVNDLASEPAAYAAAALQHLGIEPSDEGVPYAVFDLGGGTADFDYGLLRWANDDEDAQGYERVFEHLASSGDNFLGGENLLEHLVYESFKFNLEMLREKRIQFTQPIDAQHFSGGGAFLSQTQVAQTNSIMLAAKLREFMESESGDLVGGGVKLDLLNTAGEKQYLELAIDTDALNTLLESKVKRGVEAFLVELARVLPEYPVGAPIHVLLAGNGTRSRYIKALFDTEGEQWQTLVKHYFGDNIPEIIVHQPLPMDEEDHYAPTSKTGVALGLLQVVPGKNTLLMNRVRESNGEQAPFAWSVGRMRRGQFLPVIKQGDAYQHWQEVGVLQQGVFYLLSSQSPRATSANGLRGGDPELKSQRLDFPAAGVGAKLYVRATKPNVIELCASVDKPESDEHYQEFLLS